jgi:hypothetical protein
MGDEEEIRKVIVENYFGGICDENNFEESLWESTFTIDAGFHRGKDVHAGRETIRNNMRLRTSEMLSNKHVISNLELKVVGDRASATCEWAWSRIQEGKKHTLFGYNSFSLRRENGHWLIEEIKKTPKGGYLNEVPDPRKTL